MYKANKSLTGFSFVFALAVFFLAGFISTTAAEENCGHGMLCTGIIRAI